VARGESLASIKVPIHGLLPINKPLGLISKDVSRKLIRKFGKLHIGHVGTLDPAADGVLPVLLGRATRLQDHLLELPKRYTLEITFGYETDTLDSEGEVVKEMPAEFVTSDMIKNAIPLFVGMIEQIPPIYSAVKLKGKPLYQYARSGKEDQVDIEKHKRTVTVYTLDFLEFSSNKALLSVNCSKGTYIRTLVKDVATALGTCGTLTRLTRTVAAGVDLDQAIDLDQIVDDTNSALADFVIPMEKIKFGFPKWKTPDERVVSRLMNGVEAVFDRGFFFEGLGKDHEEFSLSSLSAPILLVNENDFVFAIGTVKAGDGDRVIVNMKRGLR
jgi:tRNA pseudouridine55 synthase